jgi:hypothetical protein
MVLRQSNRHSRAIRRRLCLGFVSESLSGGGRLTGRAVVNLGPVLSSPGRSPAQSWEGDDAASRIAFARQSVLCSAGLNS